MFAESTQRFPRAKLRRSDLSVFKLMMGVMVLVHAGTLSSIYVLAANTPLLYLSNVMPASSWVATLVAHGLARIMRTLYRPEGFPGRVAFWLDEPLGVLIWGVVAAINMSILFLQPEGIAMTPLCVSAPLFFFFANLWLTERSL
jgi:hypothetical protein